MKRIRPARFVRRRGRHPLGAPSGSAPGGATLTEVLMSILVMGIGVLSVISLFPAAFLRTLQATNLTHATILRYNADSLIDLDRDHRANLPNWQPNKPYNLGDSILGRPPILPNIRFVCTTAGTSVGAEPAWDTIVGNPTNDGPSLVWTCFDHNHDRYIIDPLGWHVLGGTYQDMYGNNGAAPAGTLERWNAGTASLQEAEALATLPDSWSQQLQSAPAGPNTLSSVTLPANIDLTGISWGVGNPPSRVVLTDASGRSSLVRQITSITLPDTIHWDSSGSFDVPVGFAASVRVETQERRYTWLLTVRHVLGGEPSVDVAVFFRRPLTQMDERIFTVTAIDNLTREVDLAHNADGTQPAAKKGGYLLDVDNARWYRIQDSIAWNANTTRVTLDRTPIDLVVNGNVVVPRGIVDVYPIGSK